MLNKDGGFSTEGEQRFDTNGNNNFDYNNNYDNCDYKSNSNTNTNSTCVLRNCLLTRWQQIESS